MARTSAKQKATQERAKERMKLAQKLQKEGGKKTIPAHKVYKRKMSTCLKEASKQLKNKRKA
ncbi:MAG: hypothetical protein LBM68_06995 [Bacteroidales bacterium]|jgi:hypothetical protein|nr:hypothetical protein [Bacteroidales bacterium]